MPSGEFSSNSFLYQYHVHWWFFILCVESWILHDHHCMSSFMHHRQVFYTMRRSLRRPFHCYIWLRVDSTSFQSLWLPISQFFKTEGDFLGVATSVRQDRWVRQWQRPELSSWRHWACSRSQSSDELQRLCTEAGERLCWRRHWWAGNLVLACTAAPCVLQCCPSHGLHFPIRMLSIQGVQKPTFPVAIHGDGSQSGLAHNLRCLALPCLASFRTWAKQLQVCVELNETLG